MAFVTLASSLTLVSLRLRLGTTRYRKEEDSAWQKDASLLRRTLLHYRRTTAMADDEYTTLPHRIRQREVNLPRTQWRSSCKMTFLSLLLSALDTTLINKYTSYVMWQYILQTFLQETFLEIFYVPSDSLYTIVL